MKKNFLIACLLLFLVTSSIYAQEKPCAINDYVTVSAPYFFDSFQEGVVVFNDTLQICALLNYNVVTDDIYYTYDNEFYSIDKRGVKFVVICNHRFYFENTIVMQMIYNNDIKLFISRKINQEELYDKKGAYSASSPNTTGTDLQYVTTVNGVTNLRNKEDKRLSINYHYKIMKNDRLYTANKKNFLKLYKNHKQEILEYIKENNIRFDNKYNLIQMTNYCANL